MNPSWIKIGPERVWDALDRHIDEMDPFEAFATGKIDVMMGSFDPRELARGAEAMNRREYLLPPWCN